MIESLSGLGGQNISSEEELEMNDDGFLDPQAEDKELKVKLLCKYIGYTLAVSNKNLWRIKRMESYQRKLGNSCSSGGVDTTSGLILLYVI